jgi:hypothetical protein
MRSSPPLVVVDLHLHLAWVRVLYSQLCYSQHRPGGAPLLRAPLLRGRTYLELLPAFLCFVVFGGARRLAPLVLLPRGCCIRCILLCAVVVAAGAAGAAGAAALSA